MSRLLSLVVSAATGVAVLLPPLGEEEAYLEPYLPICMEYRDNPAVQSYVRFINMEDLIQDYAPAWIENLIQTLYPGLTIPIPVDESLIIHLDLPGLLMPINGEVHLTKVIFRDFNKIKQVKPITLKPQTRFTWNGGIVMQDLTVVLQGEVTVEGQRADIQVTLYFDEPVFDIDTVLALNETRICDVWSNRMDPSCLLWTVMFNEFWVRHRWTPRFRIDTGLNLTNMSLGVHDLYADVAVEGKSKHWDPRWDPIVSKAWTDLIQQDIQVLKARLQHWTYLLRGVINVDLTAAVRRAHNNPYCTMPKLLDISGACIHSDTRTSLEGDDWSFVDCPGLRPSQSPAPVASNGCVDVLDVFANAVEGQVLRIAVQTDNGPRLIDGAFRFVPDSQDLLLSCSSRSNCTWQVEASQSAHPMILLSLELFAVIATLAGMTIGQQKRSRARQAEVLAVSLQPTA